MRIDSLATGAASSSSSSSSSSSAAVAAAEPRLVPLASAEGEARCAAVLARHGAHSVAALRASFVCQAHDSYCGMASLAIAFNSLRAGAPEAHASALAADAALPPPDDGDDDGAERQQQSREATAELGEKAAALGETHFAPFAPSSVRTAGVTLAQLADAAARSGVFEVVSIVYAASAAPVHESHQTLVCASLDAMRRALLMHLAEPAHRVLLNYHMTTLGQAPWGGHISPVGAYHEATDSLLVLDVWPQTGPLWAPMRAVFHAAAMHDAAAQAPRGFVVLRLRGVGEAIARASVEIDAAERERMQAAFATPDAALPEPLHSPRGVGAV